MARVANKAATFGQDIGAPAADGGTAGTAGVQEGEEMSLTLHSVDFQAIF